MTASTLLTPKSARTQSISACCHGKQTQTGGYVFEFDTEAAAPEVIGDEEWRDVVLDD